MKNLNKIIAAIALMLAIALSAGITGIGIDTDAGSAAGEATGTETEIVMEDSAAADEFGDWWKNNGGDGSGTDDKNLHVYGDGSTVSKYDYKDMFTSRKADPNAKTVVKSGISNPVSGKAAYENGYGVIDVSRSNEGYVTLKLTKSVNAKVKGFVKYSGADGSTAKFTWYMDKDKSYDIPMYMGDGKYEISICENTSGSKYAVKLSVALTVKLDSELAPFLASTKDANYAIAPDAVAKAKELTKNCKTTQEKINEIYNWVYDNIEYDYAGTSDKTGGVQASMVYDLDAIMAKGKGVCGDRAALMAGMLRSIGIPCKLVWGASDAGNHIWIAVWNETGTSEKDGVTYGTGSWVELNTTSRAIFRETKYEVKYYM